MTPDEYHEALAKIHRMSQVDPEPSTDFSERLLQLVEAVEAYEREHFPEMFSVFQLGDAVLFTDKDTPSKGTVPGTIAEVISVPSGCLYVVELASGGRVQPVFPQELVPQVPPGEAEDGPRGETLPPPSQNHR